MSNRRLALLGLVIVLIAAALVFRTIFWKVDRPSSDPSGAPTASTAPAAPTTAAKAKNQRPADTGGSPLQLASGSAERDESLATGAFEGRVVSWSTQKGVAGAAITFDHGGVTASVISGPDGAFRFVPPEAGVYTIALVSGEGYFPFAPAFGHSPITLSARKGERIRDIRIYLVPAVNYTGVVIAQGEAREPIKGAEIRVLDEDGGDATIAPLPDRFTADDTGQFRFSAPDYAILEARHPDYLPGRARVDFAAQVSKKLVIRLSPKGAGAPSLSSIAGRVVDQKGVPVEGAHIVAEGDISLAGPIDASLRPWPQATSDEEGKFSLETNVGERFDIVATYQGLAPAYASSILSGTQDLTLKLATGATLRGRVFDQATGTSVAAFTVTVYERVGPLQRREIAALTVFDAQGRYEVPGLGPADYAVFVAAHGYAPSPEAPFSVPDPPTDPAPVDIALPRGGRVTGNVLQDKTRKPIESARVSIEGRAGAGPSAAPILASTTTDANGRFELGGIGVGLQSITIVAEGHHGRIVSGLAVTEGGDVGPITVELSKTEPGEEPKLELTGIGAVLSAKDDALLIGQVFEGGGAHEDGLVAGDAIVGIDGQIVVEIGFEQAIQRIRGPEGSRVLLTLRRAAGGDPTNIQVTRRRIRN